MQLLGLVAELEKGESRTKKETFDHNDDTIRKLEAERNELRESNKKCMEQLQYCKEIIIGLEEKQHPEEMILC